jgi:ABC-type molybdate transport system permease subunit
MFKAPLRASVTIAAMVVVLILGLVLGLVLGNTAFSNRGTMPQIAALPPVSPPRSHQ